MIDDLVVVTEDEMGNEDMEQTEDAELAAGEEDDDKRAITSEMKRNKGELYAPPNQ
mgnify:CR=1 FL=1